MLYELGQIFLIHELLGITPLGKKRTAMYVYTLRNICINVYISILFTEEKLEFLLNLKIYLNLYISVYAILCNFYEYTKVLY